MRGEALGYQIGVTMKKIDCRMKMGHTKDNGLTVFLYFPSSFSQSKYRTLLLVVSAENMGVLI